MFTAKPTTKASASALHATGCRSVVCRAASNRRTVLGSVVAGIAAVSAGPSLAASSDATAGFVDLFDDRKAKKKGFEIIYEARDLDIPQNERDGLTQFRGDLKATRERYKEATKRIQNNVKQYIEKQYWTDAKEELRNQVGTFRFDLKNLASSRSDKDARREGIAKAKDLVTACERLDYVMTKKDLTKARENYDLVIDKLKSFDSFVSA